METVRNASQRDVLVVDDDASIRDTVSEILELEGYCVQVAANGAEALESLRSETPNVVLLDMRMPVLDGWGFARELQRRGIKIPIVVMTAAQSAQKWASEIAAADFLAKPFDLDDLVDTVDRTCRQPGTLLN